MAYIPEDTNFGCVFFCRWMKRFWKKCYPELQDRNDISILDVRNKQVYF